MGLYLQKLDEDTRSSINGLNNSSSKTPPFHSSFKDLAIEKKTSIGNLDENIEFHPWTSIFRLIIHPERLDSSVRNIWPCLPESFLRSVSRKTFALSSSTSSSSSVLLQRSTETEKRSCIFSRKRRVDFCFIAFFFPVFQEGFGWAFFFAPPPSGFDSCELLRRRLECSELPEWWSSRKSRGSSLFFFMPLLWSSNNNIKKFDGRRPLASALVRREWKSVLLFAAAAAEDIP